MDEKRTRHDDGLGTGMIYGYDHGMAIVILTALVYRALHGLSYHYAAFLYLKSIHDRPLFSLQSTTHSPRSNKQTSTLTNQFSHFSKSLLVLFLASISAFIAKIKTKLYFHHIHTKKGRKKRSGKGTPTDYRSHWKFFIESSALIT